MKIPMDRPRIPAQNPPPPPWLEEFLDPPLQPIFHTHIQTMDSCINNFALVVQELVLV